MMRSRSSLERPTNCNNTSVVGRSVAPAHAVLDGLRNRLRDIDGDIRQLELYLQSEAESDLRETLGQKNKALASLADEVAALEQKNVALSERNVALQKENADMEKGSGRLRDKLDQLERILAKEGIGARCAERTDA